MYGKEIEFVRQFLNETKGDASKREAETFRSRIEHTLRVLNFANKIIENLSFEEQQKLDLEAIRLTCIFHDVAYGIESFKNSHGIEGSKVFRQYAKDKYDPKLIEKVCEYIYVHQDKELIYSTSIPEELRIVLEADILDEEGSLGIAWDLMTLGQTKPKNYIEAINKIQGFSAHILQNNPMKHKYSYDLWAKKQKLIKDFLDDFNESLY
jgi:uncharacterized protein